jgi:hypothetical protein
MQQIGEGMLEIPGDWYNATVNVFTAAPVGSKGLSVTVNRDKVAYGTSIHDYAVEQRNKLKDQLQKYQIINEADVTVDGQPGQLLELTWTSPDAGDIHQLLLTLAHGQVAINFAATCVGKMTQEQRKTLIAMLLSFRFNANCAASESQ